MIFTRWITTCRNTKNKYRWRHDWHEFRDTLSLRLLDLRRQLAALVNHVPFFRSRTRCLASDHPSAVPDRRRFSITSFVLLLPRLLTRAPSSSNFTDRCFPAIAASRSVIDTMQRAPIFPGVDLPYTMRWYRAGSCRFWFLGS
jgi:hypothetical protein